MSVPNQAQVQKQVTTQAIAQTNSAPANKQTAIATTPAPTHVDPPNNIPEIVSNPTVSIILAFAVFVQVIISGKK